MAAITGERRAWTTQYPPLLMLGAVLFLLLVVLPSSLNLPQANTQTTPEYAPVPPSDDDPPPSEQGNLSSLSLASNGDLGAGTGEGDGGGGGGGGGTGPGAAVGAGKNPSTKRCVGRPPRQSEDPLAPPCVAFFNGDNGGSTYPGVTAEEVRILVYLEGNTGDAVTPRGQETRPSNTYKDVSDPALPDDHITVRVLRAWQRHFNERYQTYDRQVRFVIYYDPSGAPTPETRRNDAAANFARVKPFAVISNAPAGFEAAYLEAMAEKGVLNFGAFSGREQDFYRRFAPRIWGYPPSIEIAARQYAGFVCKKVVNHNVSFSGNRGDIGKARKLGFLSTTDPAFPALTLFAKVVKEQVKACGGEIVSDRTFPFNTGVLTDSRAAQSTYAAENMATFRDKGVTTVIWAAGYENQQSKAAAQINYLPEWIVAGAGRHEGYYQGQFQDQQAWRYAWAITNIPLQAGSYEETDCVVSAMDGDPNMDIGDPSFACFAYPALYDMQRQLFTGIQVAGPRLTPESLDKGMHAIPPVASNNPSVPACFYEPNDYTCMKDAAATWYDPDGKASGSNAPGCWRWANGGQRYLVDRWPSGDVLTLKKPDDPCGNTAGGFSAT